MCCFLHVFISYLPIYYYLEIYSNSVEVALVNK